MIKHYNILLTGIFSVLCSNLWALPETITTVNSTTLASQPLFGRDKYHLSSLNPGARAEIISVSTQHQGGVALQVRSIDGPSKGQVGWVYLSSDESKRNFKVLDEGQKEVILPHVATPLTQELDDGVLENLATPRRINNPTNDFKRAFIPLSQSMTRLEIGGVFSKEPAIATVKSDKEIWDAFVAGKMKLEEESYGGGKFFTFSEVTRDSDGSSVTRRYTAAYNSEYLGRLPQAIQEVVKMDPECSEDSPQVLSAAPGFRRWQPGCEVLATNVSTAAKDKLGQCLSSIKALLAGGKKIRSSDRVQIFNQFYSKLNPQEQEFIAHIVTSIGEAGVLAPPIEEMVAIMMILENRKEYARSKGFHDANALDAALQPSQFSMYNRGAHHWSDALNRNGDDEQTQHALNAFVKFKESRFTPTQRSVYHYHTNQVNPDWKTPTKRVAMNLGGVDLKKSGKRHIFYRDIGWSFRNNPWSKK